MSKSIIVRDGKAEMTVPFVQSDAPGAWRAVATDILTGASAAVEIVHAQNGKE